ncbi:hypothetical protein HCH52_10780 [Oscillospiraceae bacterium HV4-5-C5C]|nr:hypothetical protein [Oscillospiraceae bacterium HV4-5-C5C]
MNEYIWQLYLKAEGQQVVDQFEHLVSSPDWTDYPTWLTNLIRSYCPSESVLEELNVELSVLSDPDFPDFLTQIRQEQSRMQEPADEAAAEELINLEMNQLYQDYLDQNSQSKQYAFEAFSEYMVLETTMLALKHPQLFIPYYFRFNYDLFSDITQAFGIELPVLPAKKDYEGRFFLYPQICLALYKFRKAAQLTPCELWAFLYDYAPRYLGHKRQYLLQELPEAQSAYFIGSAPNDIFLSDDPDYIAPWQCSPDTKAGDWIVMYMKSPVSAVNAVWRSVSTGFIDPFFYYYRCCYISKHKYIKAVALDTLKHDPVLSAMTIVRKNMQGVNGVELQPSQFNYLMRLAEQPETQLSAVCETLNGPFKQEKDVEKLRIRPLLERLGYSESDYKQQLCLILGNHQSTLIPDFVLRPVIDPEHYHAFAVVEAKLKIRTQQQLTDAQRQVRGYAKLLNAQYAVVADEDQLWLMASADDYSDSQQNWSWGELAHNADAYSQLRRCLGYER